MVPSCSRKDTVRAAAPGRCPGRPDARRCRLPIHRHSFHSAFYSSKTNRIFWFIHASDLHIGTGGSTDSNNLSWLVTTAKNTINPSFIVVSGDLTDSTNDNSLGYPDGPYQEEWNLYKSIVDGKVDAGMYFDIPGNHDDYKTRISLTMWPIRSRAG